MVVLATVAVLAWLAMTVGAVAVSGALPAPLLAVLPGPVAGWLPDEMSMAAALGLYLAGAAVLVLLAYVAAAVSVLLARSRPTGQGAEG